MTPDQPRGSNGRWQAVSLRDYFHALLTAAREFQETKWEGHGREHEGHAREHALIATALGHQEIEAAEWRKAANEWRGTVGDLSARYVTRDTLDDKIKAIKAEVRQNMVIAIALTSAICTALGFVLRAMGL